MVDWMEGGSDELVHFLYLTNFSFCLSFLFPTLYRNKSVKVYIVTWSPFSL